MQCALALSECGKRTDPAPRGRTPAGCLHLRAGGFCPPVASRRWAMAAERVSERRCEGSGGLRGAVAGGAGFLSAPSALGRLSSAGAEERGGAAAAGPVGSGSPFRRGECGLSSPRGGCQRPRSRRGDRSDPDRAGGLSLLGRQRGLMVQNRGGNVQGVWPLGPRGVEGPGGGGHTCACTPCPAPGRAPATAPSRRGADGRPVQAGGLCSRRSPLSPLRRPAVVLPSVL